jgi:glycosyltransferase involved in cell wall biosynthesis
MSRENPKLLFFVTVDWFFCSHFLDRAIAAKNVGFDVLVLTDVQLHGEIIKSAGLNLIPIHIDRRSLNPFAAVLTLFRVVNIYRREKPDILHHVALKPIFLGTLAALLTRRSKVINAVVGMGYAFTSNTFIAKLIRPILKLAFRLLLNPISSKVVFENAEDLSRFVSEGTVRLEDAVLIKGAGVIPEKFCLGGTLPGIPVVVLVARLLWDKGIVEFVKAARVLHNQGVAARFWIVGGTDDGNRASIDEETLSNWRDEGIVEFLGYRSDVRQLLAQCHIACLPSYREGLPKSLLEAMAAGLPCVTTDVPGCREVVLNGDNGILVAPGDYLSLANAIKTLIQDPIMRKRMGEQGKLRLEQEFSERKIVAQTLELYRLMQAESV